VKTSVEPDLKDACATLQYVFTHFTHIFQILRVWQERSEKLNAIDHKVDKLAKKLEPKANGPMGQWANGQQFRKSYSDFFV